MLKRLALVSAVLLMSILLSSCALISAKNDVESIKENLVSTDMPMPTSSIPDKEYGTIGEFFGKVGDGLNEFAEELGTSIGEAGNKLADELAGKTSDSGTDISDAPKPSEIPTPSDVITGAEDKVKEDIGKITENIPSDIPTENPTDITDVPEWQQDDELVLDGPYHISYVVDGDTVKFEEWGSDVRVRLIGVDTPESVASDEYLAQSNKQNTAEGKDASAFLKEYLPKGAVVWVERDVETLDRYGRELVYLYAEKDGELVFVNELLLRNGLAKQFTLAPNVKYSDNKFLEAQRYARENEKGFWGTGFFEE